MKLVANGWKSIIPNGWEDRSMITLVGAMGTSGFAPNIVVTREKLDPPMSLVQYAQTQKEAMMQELPNVAVLDERELRIKNVLAFQRLQRFQIENQFIQQAQTFFLSGDTILAVTGTATVEDFNNSIDAFREFVENFEIAPNE